MDPNNQNQNPSPTQAAPNQSSQNFPNPAPTQPTNQVPVNPSAPSISPNDQLVQPTSNQTFQTSTPAPNQNNPNNLPPLPITPANQVYLHPEKTSQYKPPSTGKNHLPLILGIVLGILSLSALFIWFFLVPRTLAVSFAKNAKDTVTDESGKTDDLNKALKNLYNAESNQNPSVSTPSSNQVLGAKSSSLDNLGILNNSLNLFEKVKSLNQNGSVHGFSTPTSDPNKTERDRRDLAVQIANKATDSKKINDKLVTLLKNPLPEEAKSVGDDLSSLKDTTAKYTDQASKTAQFYIDVSDTGIDLYNLSSSTSVDNIINQLGTIKKKYVNYSKNGQLPDKMDKFNTDLIDILDTLQNMYIDVKNTPNPTADLEQTLANKYKDRLASDMTSSITDEISFWKINPALSNYNDLSSQQTDVLKSLDQIKQNNNFFILDWMGVS